jgi:hypothetical protein
MRPQHLACAARVSLVDIESGGGIQWIVGNNDEMPSLSEADVFPVSASLQAYRSREPGSGSGLDTGVLRGFSPIDDYRSAQLTMPVEMAADHRSGEALPTDRACRRARGRQGAAWKR